MATTHAQEVRGQRRMRKGAALLGLAAVLSVTVPNLGAHPAAAAPVTASGATLTWKVSTNAFTSGSLSPAHATTAPATKDADNGFVFPQGGGTFDAANGAASIHWGGSLTLGNTNQGNYRITLSNLHLALAGGGTGRLEATVTWLCNAAGQGCTAGQTATTDGVTVVNLSGLAPTVANGKVTFTVTPDFPLQADQSGQNAGRRQFPQSFLDALATGLQGHFRDTVTPVPNPDPKAPSPMTISFDVAAATTSSTSTSTSSSTSSSSTSSTSTSTTVAATTSTTAPPSDEIVDGTLDWGVKASFRTYITGSIAHGTATPGDGAVANADGTYRFPNGEGEYAAADDAALSFDGSVRFLGHDGALDLVFREPRVAIDGDDGVLVVDVTSKALSSGQTTTYDDLAFADLDLAGITPATSGSTVTLAGVPAVLSTEGAPAFAGFYTAGTALDPVTLRLTLAGGGGGSTTSTTAPGVTVDKTSVAAGSTVQVAGNGFLAGEQVQVYLHSTPQLVTVLTADANGRAASSITIPASTAAGSHEVELRGVTSGRSIRSAPFTVTSGSSLPRTGSSAVYDAFRLALVLLGFGLLLSGRSITRPRT